MTPRFNLFSQTIKSQFQPYENVHFWLPSKRPRFRNTLTQEEVRLDLVGSEEVRVTRECGSTRWIRKADFLKKYKRL